MGNKFCLLYCRFHAVKKNKLSICGYWKENRKRDTKLVVSLDYSPLEFEIEKQRMIKNPLSYIQQGEYEEKQFLWIDLPENYREYKKVRVFERFQTSLKEIFSADTIWLEGIQKEIPSSIDEITYEGGKTLIRGWCIAGEDYEIHLFNRHGRRQDSVRYVPQRRPDVEQAYPECEREWIHGFVLEAEGRIKGQVQIEVECDGARRFFVRRASGVLTGRRTAGIKELMKKAYVYYQQFGIERTMKRVFEKITHKERNDYDTFRLKYFPDRRQLELQRKESFAYRPEFSIIVPLYKTPIPYLEEFLCSVREQTYTGWKLYLADGSGEDEELRDALKRYEEKDDRIRVLEQDGKQYRIAENTNRALREAEGDFIVFADHDDLLTPDALYECVKALNKSLDTDVIYTDEDKVSEDGRRYYQPHFKPDFNIDLLRSANYMCHLYIVRRTLAEQVGLLDPAYEGSQDYDFILRCIEKTERILHIPKILYHWRIHSDSVAGNPDSKSYAYEAGKKAILAHYRRVGIKADIEFMTPGYYRSVYRLESEPLVSIIIPNKDHKRDLERCICSIIEKSDYKNYEIIVVENNSEEEEIWEYYRELEDEYTNIRILVYEKEFNYSAIQNFAAQRADGEYLLLLNNDTWMEEPGSIREMLTYCMREDVGIVGAKLLYPDDTIQHAGVIVGLGGVAGHAFAGAGKDEPGYFCRITCVQDYSAVTAACMMVKRSVYEEVCGMDTRLQVAFNDTDFCLRAGEKGYRIIYQPFAVWYHDESKTRGLEDTEEKLERFQREIEFFRKRWRVFLEKGDPNYNPNLTLDKHDFSLRS